MSEKPPAEGRAAVPPVLGQIQITEGAGDIVVSPTFTASYVATPTARELPPGAPDKLIGFYWIRPDPSMPWTVGRWDGDAWFLIGDEAFYDLEDEVKGEWEIGERLMEPK